MISVVIPLYNKANQVATTLQSVLNQSFTDYEIIVVDDGSTDGSSEIVESLNIPNLRLIRQQNAGVSAARNCGIAAAQGEFIALLDADDEWKPDYLQTQFNLTQKYPQCDVFATDYEFRDSKGKITPTIIRNLPFEGEDGVMSNYFKVAATSNPPICSISIMASKEAFQTVGGFPTDVKSGEDLLTWARLATKYKIAYSKKRLAIFNQEAYNLNEKPKRIPANEDIVGRGLKLLKKEKNSQYLRQYRAMWHKMRASCYMRLRLRGKAYFEIAKSIRLNPLNYKLYAYLIINSLPKKIQPF